MITIALSVTLDKISQELHQDFVFGKNRSKANKKNRSFENRCHNCSTEIYTKHNDELSARARVKSGARAQSTYRALSHNFSDIEVFIQKCLYF